MTENNMDAEEKWNNKNNNDAFVFGENYTVCMMCLSINSTLIHNQMALTHPNAAWV